MEYQIKLIFSVFLLLLESKQRLKTSILFAHINTYFYLTLKCRVINVKQGKNLLNNVQDEIKNMNEIIKMIYSHMTCLSYSTRKPTYLMHATS